MEDRLTALEQQIDALQREVTTATNRDIPLLKDTVRAMLHGEIETVDELSVAGRALGRAVVKRGERLSQLEAQVELLQQSTDPSTKTERMATVLTFAANKAAADGKVAVTPAEIAGVQASRGGMRAISRRRSPLMSTVFVSGSRNRGRWRCSSTVSQFTGWTRL